ncbi:hypothetical protein BKA63DRAFT_79540 [Paraphoma chrysanthemicola]|nr:hypothetical protein BKA63DRAFT_79540 [Paraphoma chrysanthemicola]
MWSGGYEMSAIKNTPGTTTVDCMRHSSDHTTMLSWDPRPGFHGASSLAVDGESFVQQKSLTQIAQYAQHQSSIQCIGQAANDLDSQSVVDNIEDMPDQDSHQLRPVASSNIIDLTMDSSDSDENMDSSTVIGTLLKSGRFKCHYTRCLRSSFGRQAELRRHYDGTHAIVKHTFWCQVPFCNRSSGVGGRAFHRKDKLRDHVRAMHGGIAVPVQSPDTKVADPLLV